MANEIKNENIQTPVEQPTQENKIEQTTNVDKKQPAKFDKKPEHKNNPRGPKKPRGRMSSSGMEEKVVDIKRISKTTKGGRRMRFSALVVIGDKKGRVGYGIGKSTEVPNAIKKAIKNANNSVRKVIMNKKGTVYHEVIGYEAASKVLVKPAKSGTGIVAGGAIRAVIELAGFKDVYTKNLGSNTKMNMVQATLNALLQQKHPKNVAMMRDKNIADL